jgi:hypothetical protein
MPRVPRPPFLLLIAAAALLAQQPSPKSPTRPRPFAFQVPYIPPVSVLPFSAEYAIQIQKPLAGGGSETWHSTTQVARDSNGRIRHELYGYVPASFTKEPPLLCVILSDRVARLTHTLDPVLRTDYKQWYHASHRNGFDPGALGGEDLGARTIDGLEVNGVRRTWTRRTRPTMAQPAPSGPPVQVVDESWYSYPLQLPVLERQTDSSGGAFTISLSHLDRSDPPASLFKVPSGYHAPSVGERWVNESPWPIAAPHQDPDGGIPARPGPF